MTTYVLSYRLPKGFTRATDGISPAWRDWFDSMGADLADIGRPVAEQVALGTCDDSTVLGGYSLVTADDIDRAVSIAERCPLLGQQGGVEVGELADLPGSR